jgi:hypothetical protein
MLIVLIPMRLAHTSHIFIQAQSCDFMSAATNDESFVVYELLPVTRV